MPKVVFNISPGPACRPLPLLGRRRLISDDPQGYQQGAVYLFHGTPAGHAHKLAEPALVHRVYRLAQGGAGADGLRSVTCVGRNLFLLVVRYTTSTTGECSLHALFDTTIAGRPACCSLPTALFKSFMNTMSPRLIFFGYIFIYGTSFIIIFYM